MNDMAFRDKGLNKGIPVPLYYQLKEVLMKEIISKKFSENEPIPTEMELSEMFEISRPTVRQALKELVNEGYLYRIKGKGTFIAKPKINQEFTLVIESYNEEMLRKGMMPKTTVLELEIEEAPEKAARVLRLSAGARVTKLKRVRYADDEPILVVTTYIPWELYPGLCEVDLEKESLYKSLENKGLQIKRAVRTFEARKVSELDRKILDMEEGEPVHYFETVAYLEGEIPIEYSFCNYRGDRNKFVIELKR